MVRHLPSGVDQPACQPPDLVEFEQVDGGAVYLYRASDHVGGSLAVSCRGNHCMETEAGAAGGGTGYRFLLLEPLGRRPHHFAFEHCPDAGRPAALLVGAA